MRKQYLECGKIVSTHGIKGEVKVQHWCDSSDYLIGLENLYLDKGERPITIKSARTNKSMVIMKISGIDDMDAAAALRGKVLYMNRDDDPDDDGVFLQDLMGIGVTDADTGKGYGTLTDVFHTGANDVYEITDDDGKKRLVPAIPDVVIMIDIDRGRMTIRPLKGLFDDED